jgi:transcriptional regulator with XRE-family HTH domain
MEPENPRSALIASRLRLARERAGLSQGQVARLLEIHRPTVSEIEAGRRRVTAEELAVFAEKYDVEVWWLLGEDNQAVDHRRDKMELAARELSKLSADDLNRVLDLLASLRDREP